MMRNAVLFASLALMFFGCSDRESSERSSAHPNPSQTFEEERDVDSAVGVRPGPWVALFDGASLAARGESHFGRTGPSRTISSLRESRNTSSMPAISRLDLDHDGLVSTRKHFHHGLLDGIDVTPFGGEGDVWVKDGQVILEPGMLLTGIGWPALELPPAFELEVTAARLSGTDFFCALTFPIGDEHATVVLGGWGGAITGLSCVDGEDASENETRTFRDYTDGQAYTLRARVDEDVVSATLDGELLFSVEREGRTFGVRPEVLLSRPVGVVSFATRAAISEVRWRALRDDP